MNERLSFLEDVKPLLASDQLRFTISVISKGYMKSPEEIEKALTPILVSLEVMESQIALRTTCWKPNGLSGSRRQKNGKPRLPRRWKNGG